MDSTTGEWTLNPHLLTAQAAIANQIARVTCETLVLDQVLDAIANQLRDTLQVSGCLIFQGDECQPRAASQLGVAIAKHDSKDGFVGNDDSLKAPAAYTESTERLFKVCSAFYQDFHSWLAQGRLVILPQSERQLPSVQNGLTAEGLAAILIVPLLYQQSCLGGLMLYQCQQEQEWTLQEISFVQAIASQCAIALTLAELEQCYQSEAKNCVLLEAIPNLIFRVNRDGIYLDWKPPREDTLAVRASQIIGKQLHQVLPTEIAGLIWEHVELACETKEIQIVEYQQGFNGKSHHFEVRIVQSGSDEAIAIVQDITEHVQARVALAQMNDALEMRVEERTAALREANRILREEIVERKRVESEVKFLHSITQALFESQDLHEALAVAIQKICEATGWDFGEAWVPTADGSALECSPAWYTKTQGLEPFRSASEKLTFSPGIGLPGRVWASQQPEWRRDVSAESDTIYLRAQLAKQVGLKAGLGIPLLTPNGILAVLVFYMFEPQDEDERLIELISASTELGLIIQRKQAEGEIRKALIHEKELTELKSRFITMTSHEFRTPLTTIQSSAELLEHYGKRWTEEKKLTHLHRIQASVKHMTRLLNDILIIGKADAGKLELNLVPLDLENFCCTLVEELQLNDTNQHIINFTCNSGVGKDDAERGRRGEEESIVEEVPVSSCPRVSVSPHSYMDEKLLRQILENLLSNAIKYSPKGSIVELTLSRFSEQAVFQICDRGIGIPPEDQQQLFEIFHRATNVGTIPGTGLGLAIVKRCVDIHEGQIAVESKVGVGTTFTITLPIYNSLLTDEENFSD